MEDNSAPKIYGAIASICEEVMAIGKNHQTTSGPQYAYRSIDDVINVMHPLLRKHRVFSVAELVSEKREERHNPRGGVMIFSVQTWKYRYYADDGSFVETQAMGEGFDSGDKSSTKAQSMAWRIAMCQLFHIPYAELMDAEAGEQHEIAGEDVLLERRMQAAILAAKDHESLKQCETKLQAYSESSELTAGQVDALRLLVQEREREIRKEEEEAALEHKASEAIAACTDRAALKAYGSRIEEHKKSGKLSAARVRKLYSHIAARMRELRDSPQKD